MLGSEFCQPVGVSGGDSRELSLTNEALPCVEQLLTQHTGDSTTGFVAFQGFAELEIF